MASFTPFLSASYFIPDTCRSDHQLEQTHQMPGSPSQSARSTCASVQPSINHYSAQKRHLRDPRSPPRGLLFPQQCS